MERGRELWGRAEDWWEFRERGRAQRKLQRRQAEEENKGDDDHLNEGSQEGKGSSSRFKMHGSGGKRKLLTCMECKFHLNGQRR
ncbi:hypothetical protein CRG98_022602 [Punica granatum]|uniref:Uncharacterized protein n=1 Tax=Punica granatum TaxID=22663 RepID=A0A2I0JN94_PUNGR|nr:hypothetical protein CRG98_022602 [Punica granatum]